LAKVLRRAIGAQNRPSIFMRRLSAILLFFSIKAAAQTDTPTRASLEEVTVQAYGNTTALRAPASIATLDSLALIRSAEFSIVPAMNRLPGVRMDERAPGSYRISLRGSTLRSPFGVRNVKIYYDDIPLTDPGGHTYFNALTPAQIGRMEIAKGPAGSLYGAGTGGIILVESPGELEKKTGAELRTLIGAYGHFQSSIAASLAGEKTSVSTQYTHRQLDGYRAQSSLRHNAASLQASRVLSQKLSIGATLLFSRLHYETPGGLTLDEMRENPRQARPRAGQSQGAEEAAARVMQTNLLAGAKLEWKARNNLHNKTVLYAATAGLDNPAIRNWGVVDEAHGGARSVWSWEKKVSGRSTLRIHAGGEYQTGRSDARTFENRAGVQGALQAHEVAQTHTGFLFAQATLQSPRWSGTAGLSANSRTLHFSNRTAATESRRVFGTEAAPRIAVSYLASATTAVYASMARGFSPPALPELSPTGSGLNPSLRAENGWNYELGARGTALQRRLRWDAALFLFRLTDAIVARRDALGGDYFLNAGGTRQAGFEASADAAVWRSPRLTATLWGAYTYYHFRYADFVQGTADFSGNAVPGAAPHSGSAGLDVAHARGIFAHLTYSAASRQPLDDGGTAWADAYGLLGVRAGVRRNLGTRLRLEISAGVENGLDARYTLGADVNAFGGRYYNPAAGRAFYAGVVVGWRR